MSLTAKELKEFAKSAGAHGCGIASPDCFTAAPKGFSPTDVFSGCRSVVVMFRTFPAGSILAENPIPYTHGAYKLYEELDRLSMEVIRFCESKGARGMIIPADVPYLSWDEEHQRGQGIISLKHAAVQAGLGIMGRSTIFISPQYGNMVYLGAILLDTAVEPDPMMTGFSCPPNCSICINSCVQHAIGGGTVNQKLCREHSFFKAGRDWDLYACNKCRANCPLRFGLRQKAV